jgi:hypothetical protein
MEPLLRRTLRISERLRDRLAENRYKEISTESLQDPLLWFTEFCYTYDPHDRENPIKRFGNVYYKDRPDYKSYLATLISVIHENERVLIPKSRQMRVTWTVVGYFVWESIARPCSYTFFQSRKESDAGWGSMGREAMKGGFSQTPGLSHLKRAKLIFERMPYSFGLKITCPKNPPKIIFSNGSTLHAISQDSDAFRQYTATGILADEVAFQENARRAFTAAIPLLDSSSKYIAVSTVNGKDEFFYPKVHDLE